MSGNDEHYLIGQRFMHYKGNIYEIVAFGDHTETSEKMVMGTLRSVFAKTVKY